MSGEEMLLAFKRLVPNLSYTSHKGQAGRIGVIGGSEEYTGAPYFGAISSLKLGADLAHVICDTSAASVIKSYSPELIVHPYLRTSVSSKYYPIEEKVSIEQTCNLLDRLHVVIFGPGMGRDPLMMSSSKAILQEIIKRNIPVVIDADGLYLVQQEPTLIKSYRNAILTPNSVEFKRLCESVKIANTSSVVELSKALGDVIIIQKGQEDIVACQGQTVTCNTKGGRRRFGGQGDVLTGAIATFCAWILPTESENSKHLSDNPNSILSACWTACAVSKTAARLADEDLGRASTTTDIIDRLGKAWKEVVEIE